jgi:hypothetical protein
LREVERPKADALGYLEAKEKATARNNSRFLRCAAE